MSSNEPLSFTSSNKKNNRKRKLHIAAHNVCFSQNSKQLETENRNHAPQCYHSLSPLSKVIANKSEHSCVYTQVQQTQENSPFTQKLKVSDVFYSYIDRVGGLRRFCYTVYYYISSNFYSRLDLLIPCAVLYGITR